MLSVIGLCCQAALSNIHTAQLEMQKIAAEEFIEAYTGANTL